MQLFESMILCVTIYVNIALFVKINSSVIASVLIELLIKTFRDISTIFLENISRTIESILDRGNVNLVELLR